MKSSNLPEPVDRIGLKILENTPEEIAQVAIEMEQRIRGVFNPSEEDEELQRRFLSIVGSYLEVLAPIENYQRLRIGAHFLRAHPELLA